MDEIYNFVSFYNLVMLDLEISGKNKIYGSIYWILCYLSVFLNIVYVNIYIFVQLDIEIMILYLWIYNL